MKTNTKLSASLRAQNQARALSGRSNLPLNRGIASSCNAQAIATPRNDGLIFRLSFIILCLIPYFTSSQDVFKTGLLAGISTSQVHGDSYSGFNKIGLAAGAFVKKKFHKDWDFKFEIIYIEKGSRHIAQPDKGDYSSYFLKLNYMEVPLMVRYYHKKLVFEAGPAFAALVKWKEDNEYGPINNQSGFEKADYTFCMGMSYTLNDRIEINVRYTNSYIPVRRFIYPLYYQSRILNTFNKGLYNNVLSFTLNYCFTKNAVQQ